VAIWHLNGVLLRLFRLSVNKLEDVVEDEVLARGISGELEGLGVAHGALLLIDEKLASDENDDTAILRGGLGIKGLHLVLDLLERKRSKLLSDGASTENGSRLESQHGLLTVESLKTLAIGIESVVVELDKLLGNRLEVSHCEYM
jgi:hypothetical protein